MICRAAGLAIAVALWSSVQASALAVWGAADRDGQVRVEAKELSNPAGTKLALRCSPQGGFSAVLILPDLATAQPLDELTIKTARGSVANPTVNQDARLPGVIRLTSLDKIEADALDGGVLAVRANFRGRDQQLWRYDFTGIETDKAKILQTCPPF